MGCPQCDVIGGSESSAARKKETNDRNDPLVSTLSFFLVGYVPKGSVCLSLALLCLCLSFFLPLLPFFTANAPLSQTPVRVNSGLQQASSLLQLPCLSISYSVLIHSAFTSITIIHTTTIISYSYSYSLPSLTLIFTALFRCLFGLSSCPFVSRFRVPSRLIILRLLPITWSKLLPPCRRVQPPPPPPRFSTVTQT